MKSSIKNVNLMRIVSCREMSVSVGLGAGTIECVRRCTTEGLRDWFHKHGGEDNTGQCRPLKVGIPLSQHSVEIYKKKLTYLGF